MQREVRAVEISEMMHNQHTVQLAIKYATRLRMVQLAQRLTEVAQRKAEQQQADNAADDDEVEYRLPTIRRLVDRLSYESNTGGLIHHHICICFL